jgi:hypothetical protein
LAEASEEFAVAEDVWTALVKGVLGFGHSRAADLVGTTFGDTGTFVKSLGDGATGTTKAALDKMKKDIDKLATEVKPLVDALKPKIDRAITAVQNGAKDLATSPFTLAAAGRVATDLAEVLIAVDESITVIAENLSKKGTAEYKPDVYKAIVNIDEPWKVPFRNLAAAATKAFDDIAKQLLGEDNASKKFADLLKFDSAEKRLQIQIPPDSKKGERTPVPAFPAFTLGDPQLILFLSYKTKAVVGVTLKTKLKAGLRGDKLLQKIIPDGAPSSDTDYTAVTLDSDKGLSFGEGKDRALTLPARFSFPGVELREFTIALPDTKKAGNEIDLKATLAAKIGDVVGMVVEGGGVRILYQSGQTPFDVRPLPPDAVGVRIDASVVKGGGYLYIKDNEYGGILDLQILKIGVTVIGLITPDPFSMVVIVSVRFSPNIELGLGFTLNGLGGILALERRIATDVLRKDIRDGTADLLLFPENPIEAAPKILEKVRDVFPAQPGGFVVGPIALLGWGSQTGFVLAKIGIVLSLPDPKLVLLGSVQIGVPSAKVEPKLRIVDLHAEIYGEFTPQYLLFIVGLNNSRIATISISGDVGLLVRWAGGENFALAVGGFHPRYTPPPELADLRRLALDLSPGISWLRIHAEGYFALTANSLQFGGALTLKADVGPASAEAWFKLNALFVWSPRFYFEADLSVGLSVKLFGFSFFGVGFTGLIKGTTPWHLEGTATVDLGFFGSHDIHLGPVEWGERDVSLPDKVSPRDIVARALADAEAWKPFLPAGGDLLVRLQRNDTPLLVHPLGALEVKQGMVPLDTTIDRIGQSPVTAHRVTLAAPMVGGALAGAVSQLNEDFAPGHFIELTKDEQVSRPAFESFPAGLGLAAARAPLSGTPLGASYQWATVYPQEEQVLRFRHVVFLKGQERLLLRTGPVATAARLRGNPYAVEQPQEVRILAPGLVSVRRRDDLGAVAEAPTLMTTTAAARLRSALEVAGMANLELVAAGVVK